MDIQFIAETDEFGGVQWVWFQGDNRMPPRPVKDLSGMQKMITKKNCHGASYEAMRRWVQEIQGAH